MVILLLFLDVDLNILYLIVRYILIFIFLNVKYIFMKKNVYTYHMKTLG